MKYIILLLLPSLLFSQEIISTQGDHYDNVNGSISFTIGEVVINTATDGMNDLTQGFHQTNWDFVNVEDYDPNFEVLIFPNPSIDVLTIVVDDFYNINYKVYDPSGKLILHDNMKEKQIDIQTSNLAVGTYILTLLRKEELLKTTQLIKTK
tara:strand:+ start:121 stop:573 length:453 start_codon:yes stop_codon:yes gene_type:complete